MNGKEMREIILNSGVLLWQVADKLNITDSNFSRKLRHDFTNIDVERIKTIIEEIKNESN